MFVQITGVKLQVMISLCLYLGQVLSGYAAGWTGPVIPKLRDLEQSPLPYLLTETQLSLVATTTYLGGIFGPYIVAGLSNTRGRKPCMIFSGLLSATAYVVLITTRNLPALFISRFMLGISGGVTSMVNLVYIGEIASPSIRGILLTATGILTTSGLLLIYSVGSHVSYYGTTYIGLGISIAYVICLLWIPESPIFYALQGNHKQITKTLEDLGRSEDINKMIRMKKDLAETSSGKDWKELFTIRSNRKALFIVATINCLQHCSGLLAVIFFSAAIFQMAGSSIQSDVAMIIVMCFQLLGSCIAPIFIESIGRKKILLISCAICSLSMFTLGLYFYLDLIGNPVVDNIKWLPLAVLVLFFISYDSGFGIVPNTLTAEMFTSNVRSKGSTVTFSTAYIFGFTVTTAFGALLETVGGHVAFWFFSCTCACAFVFSIFFVPETTGKTLTQIQEDLGNVCLQ